ncbi:MAG: amidohydrolase family protein [Saprospiraceae bacterium]
MKYFYPIFLLCICTFFSCQTATTTGTIIQNVNVLDVVNGLRKNQTVVLQNERIYSITDGSKINPAATATVIDGTNKFLMPGLWDAHVHMVYDEAISPVMNDLFLAYGITSVRDTGGQLHLLKKWREEAKKNPNTTPRLMVAGPLLDGDPVVYDGSPGRPPLGMDASSAERAKRTVDSLAAAKVDLIKSYEMLTPEAFKSVIETAASHNLVVTGHVPLSMDVISAAKMGLRSMEHLRNLEMSCAENWEALLTDRRNLLEIDSLQGGVLRSRIHAAQRSAALKNQSPEQTQKVLAALAENDVWQCPTLTINAFSVHRLWADETYRTSYSYLPDSTEQQWTKRSLELSEMPADSARGEFGRWSIDLVDELEKNKIGILAGTDTPIAFLTPGLSLHHELELLVQGGLTPKQALTAATLRPAQYFNLEKEIGVVEAGKLADLLLLNANPLENISNTQQIETVFRNGKMINPQAILERLKAK